MFEELGERFKAAGGRTDTDNGKGRPWCRAPNVISRGRNAAWRCRARRPASGAITRPRAPSTRVHSCLRSRHEPPVQNGTDQLGRSKCVWRRLTTDAFYRAANESW